MTQTDTHSSDRKVLVTGGTRGIGAGIVQAFLDQGAHVAFCGRSASEQGAAFEATGRAHFVKSDLASLAAPAELVAAAARLLGGIDVVVHCAAIFPTSPIDRQPLDDWQASLQVNLTSAMLVVQASLPHLRQATDARIVMVSSITGPKTALPGLSAYASSKGGLEAFVRAAGMELASEGITVNAVSPGTILTEGLAKAFGDDGLAMAIDKIPAHRIGAPGDIANAIQFFASPASSYITGQSLIVDGGQTLVELF
ncbi:MAG: fabg3 [Subtercola sp.]|nr:fabg3 [Subtercola sp.]